MPTDPILKTYLLCYGADNEFWLCQAEDPEHAIEQFKNADMGSDINDVFQCKRVNMPRHLR